MLGDDGIAESSEPIGAGSAQPQGRPISHSTNRGLSLLGEGSPSVDVSGAGREDVTWALSGSVLLAPTAASDALASPDVGVGHAFASVSRLARTGPVRPAAPPWFVS